MDTGKHTLAAIAAVLLALCWTLTTVPAWADDPPKEATSTQAADEAKGKDEVVAQTAADAKAKSQSATPAKANPQIKSGNALFMCRCGMAFTPTPTTQAVSHEGGQYRVCSDACFKAASADPAKAAAEAQAHMKRLLAQTAPPSNPGAQAPKPN